MIDLHNMELGIKIGHYKVGFYRTIVEGARDLGHYQCLPALEDTLQDLESTLQQTEQLGNRITAQTIQRTSP